MNFYYTLCIFSGKNEKFPSIIQVKLEIPSTAQHIILIRVSALSIGKLSVYNIFIHLLIFAYCIFSRSSVYMMMVRQYMYIYMNECMSGDSLLPL